MACISIWPGNESPIALELKSRSKSRCQGLPGQSPGLWDSKAKALLAMGSAHFLPGRWFLTGPRTGPSSRPCPSRPRALCSLPS